MGILPMCGTGVPPVFFVRGMGVPPMCITGVSPVFFCFFFLCLP
jgi:hypothetical protein